MLITHAFVMLVLFSIQQLKNVNLLVMDSQVVNAMAPICLLALAVLEVHVIMVHAFAGQDLRVLIALQRKQ